MMFQIHKPGCAVHNPTKSSYATAVRNSTCGRGRCGKKAVGRHAGL